MHIKVKEQLIIKLDQVNKRIYYRIFSIDNYNLVSPQYTRLSNYISNILNELEDY